MPSAITLPRPVLLTGFDAFGATAGSPPETNPSWRVVRAFEGQTLAGHPVVTALLPTQFGRSIDLLREKIALHLPVLVICVGVAESRQALSLERIAINIDDARIADNAGRQPIDTPVISGGPAGLFSTLPIKAMAAALRQNGIRADISQTAGTFVCNHVFYGLLHRLQDNDMRGVRGGFIHLPLISDRARGIEGMLGFEDAMRALHLCVELALNPAGDIAATGGSID